MTRATKMLSGLVLMDSAKIAEEDAAKHSAEHFIEQNSGQEILYTRADVEKLFGQIAEVEYDIEFSIGEFKVNFIDAGHILGSASIEISDSTGKRVVFSGDLGNTPEDMIRPTEKIAKADCVVMESTYGDRLHTEEDPNLVLQEEINEIERTNGVLLIPSFSIERAQELLHRINHLKNNNQIKPGTKVFLDSPMAIRATEIFRRSPELYNRELTKDLKTDDPFSFPGLTMTLSANDSKQIILSPNPKVIISGSGMMHGGRILHHAMNYLSDNKTRVLIVGYQALGTLGRRLMDGEKRVMIYNQEVNAGANVRVIEVMSCHADQKKLLRWLEVIKGVKKVFLTHGENEARRILAEKIRIELKINEVVIPKLGEKIFF